MRFDSDKKSGIWLLVDDSKYCFKLAYPEYLCGTVCKDVYGQPLQPGDFLLLLFNADYSMAGEFPYSLDGLLDTWQETHPESVNALEDVLNDALLTIAPELWGSAFEYSEKHAFLIAELLMAHLYDTVMNPADNNIELLGDELSRIRAFSYMLIENESMPDECRSLIHSQMPRVRFCFKDGKAVQQYYIRSVFELFAIDAYYFTKSRRSFAFCQNCGRYFKQREKKNEKYCNYPNHYLGGLTCQEYMNAHPGYKDIVTELSRRAEKTQNKYCSNHPEKEDLATAYGLWSAELKKQTQKARITRDIEPLKRFIKKTRFSKKKPSDIDYSVF